MAVLAALLTVSVPGRAEKKPKPMMAPLYSAASKTWTIKLDTDKGNLKGDIKIYDMNDELEADLAKVSSFIIKPQVLYKIEYLDIPKTLTTEAKKRMHKATFWLIDSTGDKIELNSYRLGIADSNVFVYQVSPSITKTAAGFTFNSQTPGAISIVWDGVKGAK
jgi:hypothetical protein